MLSYYYKALLAAQELSYAELEKLEKDIAEIKEEIEIEQGFKDSESFKGWYYDN